MNNPRIIYTNPDGSLAVIIPTGELTLAEVIAKDVPAGVVASVVDASQLPAERDFRGAWEHGLTGISVSLPKAREITKARLRNEREPLLAAQDIAFQRAFEENADTAAIVAEKKRLRDITKRADQANTLDELRAIKV